MLTHRGGRLAAPALGALVLGGTWLGHTLEYVRVAPQVGLGDALLGPLHRPYVLPFGAALAAVALAGGGWWLTVWDALGRRLDDARAHLRRAWRGIDPGTIAAKPLEPTLGARFGVLAAGLTIAQVAAYTVQENLEASAAGSPLPGLGVIAGRHWAAPIVHLGVALVLAGTVVLLRRLLARRETLVLRCERLLAAFARSLARRPISPTARTWWAAPVELLGTHLWGRSPPLRVL